MVKAVLFDIGNTLDTARWDSESKEMCRERIVSILETHKIFKYGFPQEKIAEMFFQGMNDYRSWEAETHRALKPEEVVACFALHSVGISDDEALRVGEELCQAYSLLYYRRTPKEGTAGMLCELKDMGLKLGIVSNTSGLYSMYKELDDLGIRTFFDSITLSAIVGYAKPDRHIFEICMRDLGVTPGECVMVGDSMERDIQGAHDVGIERCIQVVSSEEKLTGELPQVVSLSAIPKIINRWKEED